MYIIQRDDGKYVAKPNSEHSYTDKLENARIYKTIEEAKNDLCPENNIIRSLRDVLGF